MNIYKDCCAQNNNKKISKQKKIRKVLKKII